jgi:hypothetical protein
MHVDGSVADDEGRAIQMPGIARDAIGGASAGGGDARRSRRTRARRDGEQNPFPKR